MSSVASKLLKGEGGEREREGGREICTCWKEDGQKGLIAEMLSYLVL